jgi:HAD superfamily phosphoserine phosphatase-like hydrolase
MKTTLEPRRQFLLASDFDQTLSFNDSGVILSEMLGAQDFISKVNGLSGINLVQQGGELAYLLLHDPEYRQVRREHLVEVGKRVRLKPNIDLLYRMLGDSIPGYSFELFVVSAAPEEVVQSALEGLVPADHIYGTRFRYAAGSGEIESILRVPAGYGKVAVLDELQSSHRIPYDRVVYVGDGSSDIHVMLHVNHRNGLTIAVSEAKRISQIAKRTVLSGDALSILVPILEDVVGCGAAEVRGVLGSSGLVIEEWEKGRTDWLTIGRAPAPLGAASEPGA